MRMARLQYYFATLEIILREALKIHEIELSSYLPAEIIVEVPLIAIAKWGAASQ